jgi:hypothetical protein
VVLGPVAILGFTFYADARPCVPSWAAFALSIIAVVAIGYFKGTSPGRREDHEEFLRLTKR